MIRRDFLTKSLLTGGAIVSGAFGVAEKSVVVPVQKPAGLDKNKFNLTYAPHFGMFENLAGKDLMDQLTFMAEHGFMALEDNHLMKKEVSVQEKIGNRLANLGMQMGVFVIDAGDNWKPSLSTGKKEYLDNFTATCKKAVEAAKRVNGKWITVVPGYYERKLPMGIQTSNVLEALRRGAEIFEPHGLVMVLEPLSDTPDLFLRNSDQTYMICKAVDSPSCKLLYDVYHMQRNEGNILSQMELTWDEIAYIQIGDNPGRNEPTTGEINYKNVFSYIYKKGYKGVLGMEHGVAGAGGEGESALINAYKQVDDFLV
ncbi:hydroxypyruvate isomerase [Flammeovirgaceae bacterium 311]|nr:hydroxypyruvate isomerase [Flammeovirgaceae bacterium 311]